MKGRGNEYHLMGSKVMKRQGEREEEQGEQGGWGGGLSKGAERKGRRIWKPDPTHYPAAFVWFLYAPL